LFAYAFGVEAVVVAAAIKLMLLVMPLALEAEAALEFAIISKPLVYLCKCE
jgi:hypothetical protein